MFTKSSSFVICYCARKVAVNLDLYIILLEVHPHQILSSLEVSFHVNYFCIFEVFKTLFITSSQLNNIPTTPHTRNSVIIYFWFCYIHTSTLEPLRRYSICLHHTTTILSRNKIYYLGVFYYNSRYKMVFKHPKCRSRHKLATL